MPTPKLRPAVIQLTAWLVYPLSDPPPDRVRSICLPPGASLPEGRFIALHQAGVPLIQELSLVRRAAAISNQACCRINIQVAGGLHTTSRIDNDRLMETYFVNLTRIVRPLENALLAQLHAGTESLNDWVAAEPARLDRLWALPKLEHIRAFSWFGNTASGNRLQLCAIRDPDSVLKVSTPCSVPLQLDFSTGACADRDLQHTVP